MRPSHAPSLASVHIAHRALQMKVSVQPILALLADQRDAKLRMLCDRASSQTSVDRREAMEGNYDQTEKGIRLIAENIDGKQLDQLDAPALMTGEHVQAVAMALNTIISIATLQTSRLLGIDPDPAQQILGDAHEIVEEKIKFRR
jgi:hypothetical protein